MKNSLKKKSLTDSEQIVKHLATEYGLITIPGIAFGLDTLSIRYSYVNIKDINVIQGTFNYDEIKKSFYILEEFLNTLGDR